MCASSVSFPLAKSPLTTDKLAPFSGTPSSTCRHSSLTEGTPLESNVLRKVASLTFDKAAMEQKVQKSKFIPEKLDFQNYEKFEGTSIA